MHLLRFSLLVLLSLAAPAVVGADIRSAEAVPHLKPAGRAQYLQFLAAEPHRAFFIAPGGGWAWNADAASPGAAASAALEACRRATPQKCVPYAIDDRVVFDGGAWPGLWGPYLTKAQAAQAPGGFSPGERFANLALRDPAGRRLALRKLAGKVVVLHFWGSWCGPCRYEMPELQALHDALGDRKDIAFVLLQVRESYERSRAWARAQGLRLALYDSGSKGESDASLALAGGATLRDRDVAAQFPTTYVLDKHGVILFRHVGPVPRWNEYAGFLRDAAVNSGK